MQLGTKHFVSNFLKEEIKIGRVIMVSKLDLDIHM